MPAQFWESTLNSPGIGAGASYTNLTTITDVSPAPQLVLPANFLYVGQSLRLTAYGTYATSGTTPTLKLGFYCGGVAGVALAESLAITTTNTVTVNWPWHMEAIATVRTIGAGTAATFMTQGYLDIATSVSAWTHVPIPATALAVSSGFNSTAAQAITTGATWGTAASTNILFCQHFVCEAMN